MIETAVMSLLVATPAIASRISRAPSGNRIFLGSVPQSISIDGGTIVVNKIDGDFDYGLGGQVDSKIYTLQIDCYDLEPGDADSLGELVGGVLVDDGGYRGQAGTAATGTYYIESIQIAGEHTEYEKPKGSTDDWRPRHHRDYRIHIS